MKVMEKKVGRERDRESSREREREREAERGREREREREAEREDVQNLIATLTHISDLSRNRLLKPPNNRKYLPI